MQLWLLPLLLSLALCSSKRSIYYLHNDPHFTQSEELQQLSENPYGIPLKIIDCTQKHCEKYRVSQLPQLVLWNGPGCSYKHLEAPNLDALQKHFLKLQNSPIRPIKDFLQGITLVEAFGVALCIGAILYTVFTLLFTDNSQAREKHKRN